MREPRIHARHCTSLPGWGWLGNMRLACTPLTSPSPPARMSTSSTTIVIYIYLELSHLHCNELSSKSGYSNFDYFWYIKKGQQCIIRPTAQPGSTSMHVPCHRARHPQNNDILSNNHHKHLGSSHTQSFILYGKPINESVMYIALNLKKSKYEGSVTSQELTWVQSEPWTP